MRKRFMKGLAHKFFGGVMAFALVVTMLPNMSLKVNAYDSSLHVSVAGTKITENNNGDVFGDGTVSYDDNTHTLTLNNATIGDKPSDRELIGILSELPADVMLTVKLIGTNVIGRASDRNLSTSGHVSRGDYAVNAGIRVYEGESSNMDLVGSINFVGDANSSLTIYDYSAGIESGDLYFGKAGGEAFKGTLTVYDYGQDANCAIITDEYENDNGGNVVITGGTLNLNSENTNGINAAKGNVTVENAAINISSGKGGITTGNGNITIENSTVNIDSLIDGICAYRDEDDRFGHVKINNSELKVDKSSDYAISGQESIAITDSVITATSDRSGICSGKINISGDKSDVTVTSKIGIGSGDGGDVSITDGIVKVNGSEMAILAAGQNANTLTIGSTSKPMSIENAVRVAEDFRTRKEDVTEGLGALGVETEDYGFVGLIVSKDPSKHVVISPMKHVHGAWAYSVDGATITAECKARGICDLPGKKISKTIKAIPQLNSSGDAYTGVKIDGLDDFVAEIGISAAPTITYYKADKEGAITDGTRVDEKDIVKTAGFYYVEIGIEGVTVKIAFNIKELKEASVSKTPQITKKQNLNIAEKFKVITGKNIKVQWGTVKDADGYDVYMAYCGKDKVKLVKSVKKNVKSATIKKLKKKAIDQKKHVKCYVVAYKMVDGKKVTIAKTFTAHAVGKKNKKSTDAKNITLAKKSYSLKKGKSATIKAKTVKVNSKLPILKHTSEFRYASSNDGIATISKKGKITAKKKGTCYVYVYAVNGLGKKIKVTVK